MQVLRTLGRRACAALLAGSAAVAAPALAARYSVTITRTDYGLPHIQAQDFASLGYGYGYAFAEDNLCTMLDDFIATRGERSRWFGPDASYSIPAVPVTAKNIDSDFFWKLMADDAAVARFRSAMPAQVSQMMAGYTDGFNRYIGELQGGQHPGAQAACATAPWLQPISADDLVRRTIRLALLASSEALITEIATAAPPAPGSAAVAASDIDMAAALGRVAPDAQPFARLRHKAMGSNMYAFGPDATTDGSSMVFGNPHFPWTGSERLYMVHLTVPGQMDIAGVSLYGTPVVLIGFNDHVAWSHTVSTAWRFTFYKLQLDRSDPTRYVVVDGSGHRSVKALQAVPLTVAVKNPDGTLGSASRTLYRSEYGPMLVVEEGGVPVLGWTSRSAFTLRDANLENTRLMAQYFGWDTAAGLDQFKQLHASVLGTPWVNTVASGPGGNAYYGDVSVVPNTPDALVQACAVPLFSPLIGQLSPGLPMMDGSRASCQWKTDADAPAAGIFGPANLPVLERRDWVGNMNDSYWLTNPAQPFTRRYARIIGDYQAARSLRTRQGILQVQRRLDGSDGLGTPYRFDLPRLQQVVLSSQVYSGELAQQSVLASVCPQARFAAACSALQRWDRRASLDSAGLPLWQEFWNDIAGQPYWKTPFDVNDPVNTPRDFDATLPGVQRGLMQAQARLVGAGVPLGAPLRQVQLSGITPSAIPIFGAEGTIGAFTVADTTDDSSRSQITDGHYPVVFGNSYLQAVTWNAAGVHAEGFLTYSESTDPANPHFEDFTRAYSAQQWVAFPFHADEIAAAKRSVVVLTGN